MSASRPPSRFPKILPFLGALLLAQTGYLAGSVAPNPFYVANVFAHHYGGLVLAIVLLVLGLRNFGRLREAGGAVAALGTLALVGLAATAATAIGLEILHNTRQTRWLLNLHIGIAVGTAAFTLFMLLAWAGRSASARRAAGWVGVGAAVGVALLFVGLDGASRNRERDRIRNPERPPAEMAHEAMGGAEGPFFPSSAATSTGGRIPSDFFMSSESCARCHADIYEQWSSSAHHFSSFNNQWYRRSIEYMQEVNSVQSSKWCAGCHDHAVLINGMMDDPVAAFLATPEAHTGLGCNSCHAVTHVKDTMGNGGFYVEYPPLHDLAVSENPLLRGLHDKAVELDPGPHKDVFLKSFHRDQTAEFCSSCHKVHLDMPVNNYRWIRGFNEYDNWQASGVSGQGARSFYYPESPMDCGDCHMPLVASDDKGNIDGFVHDHSFFAANTAVPTANLDEEHLAGTIEFLQRNQVTVDIFAAGAPKLGEVSAAAAQEPELASTFAVGEEAAMSVGRAGGGVARELGPLWGPLDAVPVQVRRGDDVRVDVVVRTRGVGHFFPGGTIDAFDVWLELRATDENGNTLFWSGVAGEGGALPADPGAHFYGARMVDAHGNPITKRNAFMTRAVAWINLIPPGAADVAHYRISVPKDCGNEIHLEARLNYRKFTNENTAFSFAGTLSPDEPDAMTNPKRATPHFDDRTWITGEVPENVSAELREIPNLPITVMHRAEATLAVTDGPARNAPAAARPQDSRRWNDYGIGLMRQGDLSGARRAFEYVTKCEPDYADAWVNLARVALQEGLLEDGTAALDKARKLAPDLPKIHYFLGVAAKEQGQYEEAEARFRQAAATYPRDRVVRNDLGRVLFLQRRYEEAITELKKVLEIDAEDLAAHYNLMLCYRGLGQNDEAEAERHLYERFKADEDADAILGPYLRAHPQDNRMRQRIHEQVSAPADLIAREVAFRAEHGEPWVALPGQGAELAKRIVERGESLRPEIAAGRYQGPTEHAEQRKQEEQLARSSRENSDAAASVAEAVTPPLTP